MSYPFQTYLRLRSEGLSHAEAVIAIREIAIAADGGWSPDEATVAPVPDPEPTDNSEGSFPPKNRIRSGRLWWRDGDGDLIRHWVEDLETVEFHGDDGWPYRLLRANIPAPGADAEGAALKPADRFYRTKDAESELDLAEARRKARLEGYQAGAVRAAYDAITLIPNDIRGGETANAWNAAMGVVRRNLENLHAQFREQQGAPEADHDLREAEAEAHREGYHRGFADGKVYAADAAFALIPDNIAGPETAKAWNAALGTVRKSLDDLRLNFRDQQGAPEADPKVEALQYGDRYLAGYSDACYDVDRELTDVLSPDKPMPTPREALRLLQFRVDMLRQQRVGGAKAARGPKGAADAL